MLRILLIGTAKEITDSLKDKLSEYGFHADLYLSGEGDIFLKITQYTAVIIIMNKADFDVISLIARCRERGIETPLMIISGPVEITERMNILNAGADDIMQESVETDKVAARLCAIIHRSNIVSPDLLCHGDITLNTNSRRVKLQGEPIDLTAKETLILELFLLHKHRVLSRRYLEEQIKARHRAICSNTMNVHISNLRRKLGSGLIETVRGQGYRLQRNVLVEE